MVLEAGDQAVQALGSEDRFDKMEEWHQSVAKMITFTILLSHFLSF